MDAADYEELGAIQLILESFDIKYNFMIENDKASFRLFGPSFITKSLRELSKEVLKRTESTENK